MQTQTVTQGTLQTREGRALPLERTDVRASITGAIADVTVRQVFRNDDSAPIEAVYLFPLPHEASVHRMLFRIADRVVHGVLKEKAEARRDYERARAEGRAATLLEEDQPALFTLSVANVAPGVTIEVELGYHEVVAYDDGRWRWVFPMVAPERYREAPAASPLALPRRSTGDRAADVSVEVLLRGDGHVEELRCPTHKVHTRDTDDGVPVVTLDDGDALPNKDFVLVWKAGDTGVRPWLRFERVEGEAGTFLLLLTPSVPREHTELMGGHGDVKAVRCGNCGGVIRDLSAIREIPGLGPVVPCAFCGAILAPGTEVITRATRPRDVLILVDRSASMRGSMPAAHRAVRALLDHLGPGDGAQLMAFDHDRAAFDGDGARFAVISPELTAMADRFLTGLTPRGGTELEAALERAAALPAREGRTRVVVLITDAAVGNEGRLLRRVPSLLGASTRLFVLGLGPAVDRRLVERLARVGGGASDVLTPGEVDEVSLKRFARRVREGGAVLTNITLYWEGAEIVDVYPKALPDLHGGDALRVFGRFTHTGMTKLVITAATADGRPYRQELEIGLPARTERAPGITRLWARRRVEELSERANTNGPDAAALRAEGLALSLAHRFVGPYTSLVAEDEQVSVPRRDVRKMKLVVTHGNTRGAMLTVARTRVVVGRGSDADLTLHDNRVSRHHAEITLHGEQWVLRDIESVNGTTVDGKAVKRVVLSAGAVIVVGDTTLRFDEAEGTFAVLPTRVDVPKAAPATDTPADTSKDEEDHGFGALDEAIRRGPLGASPSGLRARHARAEEGGSGAFEREASPAGPPPPRAPSPPPAAARAPSDTYRPVMPAFGAAPAAAPAPRAPAPAAAAPPPAVFGPPPGAMAGPPVRFGAAPPVREESAHMPDPFMAAPRGGGGFFSKIVDAITGRDHDAPPVEAPPPPPPPPPPPHGSFGPMPPPTNMPMPPRHPAPLTPPPTSPPRPTGLGPMGPPPNMPPPPRPVPPPPPPPPPPAERALVDAEPYRDDELAWFASRGRGALDLVFLVDETGSMGAYIAQVRTHLLALVAELRASPLCRMLRLGIVSYRDHPPQDHTYASRTVALTDDIEAIRREVEMLTASGGGDGPESVTDGLYDLVRLDWRPDAARAVVWFGDAPPHGVEPQGDSFPDGCPCGHHWFTQAESCREMGVTVYAIGCLPGIRSFQGAEAVFRQVASTTHGAYLPLREASLLAPMIVGAASAELDRQRIDEHVADLVASAAEAFADTTEAERVAWLARALTAKSVRVRGMDLDAEAKSVAKLRFRAVTEADVAGSLDRLRFQGRVTA